MEPQIFSQLSQQSAIFPCSEPDQSSPRPPILSLQNKFQYYPPIYDHFSQVVPFPEVSPPKSFTHKPEYDVSLLISVPISLI